VDWTYVFGTGHGARPQTLRRFQASLSFQMAGLLHIAGVTTDRP
jgi:hypothetical protein